MAAKDHRCMRIVDIVKELQDEGKAFYDRSFIRGNVKESMELKIRYNPGKSHIELKGRTKAQVANDMRALRDVGSFYTQHGLVLLSGGSAQALSRRGVKGVHDSVTLRDTALHCKMKKELLAAVAGKQEANDHWVSGIRPRGSL